MAIEEDAVIELLGVGAQDARKAWLFRKVCARLQRGTLSAIVAGSPVQTAALLDALIGRRIPDEGRVWVSGVPLMRETRRRIRALVGEATADAAFVPHRSVLWNTRVTGGTVLAGLLRFPRPAEQGALGALTAVGLDWCAGDPLVALSPADRLGVAVARSLVRHPAALVLRDVDVTLGRDGAAALLGMMQRLVRSHRLTAVVSLASLEVARTYADRVFVLAHGRLVADTSNADASAATAARAVEWVVR